MDVARVRKIVEKTIETFEREPFVKIGVSNRHIHISRVDLELLFGEGYELTPVKELLPGQYACSETVAVIGPKGRFERVRVLGPVRGESQLELSLTDGFVLGVTLPVNESGNLNGAAFIVVENQANGARIERRCAIAALRHVHLTPDFARRHALRDKQVVSVACDGVRAVVYDNVLLRVSKDFVDEMHIDTDEANAGGIRTGDYGKILLPKAGVC